MAEEVQMSPVNAVEPPPADPLSKMGVTQPKTLKLNPMLRKPTAGATQTALRPGLKLPPKPGATQTALRPGLKLPPKPGATQTALRPGLKLPPKPGATQTALRPGLKLPPKPGATQTALKPSVKVPSAAPVAAPTVAPAAPVVPVDQQGVGKLPTVEAKPLDRAETTPVVSEAPKPLEALKSVTQKLKGITQQIPQQAILRKTGIIAEGAMSDAQKEAAKHKTSRISLSDAMGVAPVKNEAAPMKTIRIKRPIDIPGAVATQPTETEPTTVVAAPAEEAKVIPAPAAPAPKSDASTTITQRKTLKIARPGGGAVRPTGKFGIKRPSATATAATKPAATAAPTESKPAESAVADIPDIPDLAPVPPTAAAVPTAAEGPAWLWTLSTVVQAAACVAIGMLAWYLYENTITVYF